MILQQTRGVLSSRDGLSLDLPFAETKSLTARVGPTPTFTRASSGTFVGSNGLIQTAATNVARFDHDPVTLASRGLLIEESRTNFYYYSQQFSFWIRSQLSLQSNAVTAPDGNLTATKLVESTAANVERYINLAITPTATPHTLSIFAKKGERNWIVLRLGGVNTFFNLNTGVATTSINNPTITNFGNEWYRCTVTSSAGTQGFFYISNNGTTTSYTGDGTSGIYIWGAQLEAGSFPTSYIPTTTASVVRSADVCSIAGAAFTGMYNPLEGSLFTSAIFNAPVAYGTGQLFVDVNDGTAANRLRCFRNATNGTAGFANTSGNSLNVAINGTTALQPFVTQKYSTGFKLDDYVFYVNNSQIGADNLGTMIVSPTTLTIGDASAGATRQYTNGTISAIRYYRKRLPNAKLASLTV